MDPSTPFIRRPVATTLLTFGLAAAGAVAFFKLPVSPLPQVDFPTISVQATLPGASPQDVATTVGQHYTLSFSVAGDTDASSTSFTAFWDGAPVLVVSDVALGFTHYSFDVVGDSVEEAKEKRAKLDPFQKDHFVEDGKGYEALSKLSASKLDALIDLLTVECLTAHLQRKT